MGTVRFDDAIGDGAGGGGTVYVRPTSASIVLGAISTYTGGTLVAHTAYLCLVPFTHVCVRLATIDGYELAGQCRSGRLRRPRLTPSPSLCKLVMR